MRVSASIHSPFYSERAVMCAQIFVDGVPIQGVVEADTDAGWADVIETRDDGKLVIDRSNPDRVALIRYTGSVTVTFKENAA